MTSTPLSSTPASSTSASSTPISSNPVSPGATRSAVAMPLGPVIVDVEGHALTEAERRRLLHPLVGGVILFTRNHADREQLKQLTADIHALRTPRLPISVDHEGGRVQRFRPGFTPIAPMRELGREWDRDVLAACKAATDVGYTIGAELRAVGVDMTYAPVLDLDYGASSVIGDRALHADERVVTMLARCLTHGLLLAGVANCGKHFPGHGFASADSHVALPVDDRGLDEILAHDGAPYGWLGRTLTAVMPSHVLYPKVDAQTAGFSSRWLKTILRRRIGFDGLIVSDDLTMAGAAVVGDIVARAEAAFSAGCDTVLVCNRPDLADELLARLRKPRNPHLARRLAALGAG